METNCFSKMIKLLNQHSAGIVVFVALFLWENKKEEEQLAQISRGETLSRLPLRLSTNRIVELVQLRDTVRPVSETTYPFILPVFSFQKLAEVEWNTSVGVLQFFTERMRSPV